MYAMFSARVQHVGPHHAAYIVALIQWSLRWLVQDLYYRLFFVILVPLSRLIDSLCTLQPVRNAFV